MREEENTDRLIAALVSDDGVLQKFAADFCCPTHLITMVVELERDEEKGEIGSDLASRSKEVSWEHPTSS